MHVLLFSWFYPPYLSAGAARLGQLAKYLTRAGIRVSVVTGRPHDLPAFADLGVFGEVVHAGHVELNALPQFFLGRGAVQERGYELSRLGRLAVLGRAYKQLVHFPDAQAGWILPAARAAARLERPDVVLSSSPPASAHVAAALFALRRGIPWVAEYRSPWTEGPYFRRWWGTRLIEDAIERALMRRASAVTAISGHLSGRLTAQLGRRVDHVPNGYDPDEFTDDVDVERGLFVHLGSVYVPYPTDVLLNALPVSAERRRVVFVGRNLANLPEMIASTGTAHLVELPGPVRRSEALRMVRSAEANLLFLSGGGRRGFTDVPQKLYEYAAARRPIIAIGAEATETAAVARATGLASFAETPQAVANALDHPTPAVPDERFLAEHSYERLASRFAALFEDAARGLPG